MLNKNRAAYLWRRWLTGGIHAQARLRDPERSLSTLSSIILWFPPVMPKALLSQSKSYPPWKTQLKFHLEAFP